MTDTVSASEIAGMLIESIEEKCEYYGQQKERFEKQHYAELKELRDEFEKEKRSYDAAIQQSDLNYELKESTAAALMELQEKHTRALGIAKDLLSNEDFRKLKDQL